ncbi:MFS transporter [Arhodomonas sp. AD133]|uniref:MFS transporter n=1 Tax=Arhodomonas sp. AD133 TaxID=3415009 RepID=UPI003EBD39B0
MSTPVATTAGLTAPRVMTFYIACLFALVGGNALTSYGMIILAHALNPADSFVGLVFMVNYLPPLFLTLYAGVQLDRRSRKRIILLAHMFYIASAFGLALVLATGLLTADTSFLLLVAACLNGTALALAQPARMAMLGDLVAHAQIGRATVILNLLMILAFGLAPVIVGVLRESLDWAPTFAILGCLVVVSNLILSALPVEEQFAVPAHKGGRLREAARYIRSESELLQLIGFSVAALFLLGPLQVLVPEFARTHLGLGEAARGALMGTLGVGLLLGGIVSGVLERRSRRGLYILGGTAVAGIAGATLGSSTDTATTGGLLLLLGIAGGVVGSLIPACIQSRTPNYLRGRVMSFYTLGFQATPALAGLVMGAVADVAGIEASLRSAGILVFVLAAVGTLFLTTLRRYQ